MRATTSVDAVSQRFWSRVQKTDACWLWTGATQHNGYGYVHFQVNGVRRPKRAHRVSWELQYGDIPPGLDVCHTCDVPACVRPDHLFLGTRSDNMKDCASKGRVCTIGKSRLTRCCRGHEFTPENTYVQPNGHRRCRRCNTYAIRARGVAKPRTDGEASEQGAKS